MKKTIFLSLVIMFTLSSCSFTKNNENEESSNLNNNIQDLTTEKNQEQIENIEVVNTSQNKEIMDKSSELNVEASSDESEKDLKVDSEMKKEEVKMMDKEWTYAVYDKSLLSNSKNNVLFFAATWCPSCKSADSNFSSEKIPENLNLLKVDYDTYTDLKKQYWITMQHTFVLIDMDWKMLKKWSGSTNSKDILSQIK